MFGEEAATHGTMGMDDSTLAPPAPPEIAHGSVAPPHLVVRSHRSRRQMETRLRLRRQLLRMQFTTDTRPPAAGDSDDQSDDGPARTSKLLKATASTGSPMQRRSRAPPVHSTTADENDVDDEDEDYNGDEDEEENDDEEDEEEATDADDDSMVDPATATHKPRTEKTVLSSFVKVLFSTSDPANRLPTVWFDYPPHLQTTRELPLSSGNRLISVSAQDCELFYKTHWERNCVKNAFAVAGLRRTKKRWSGWHMAWAKHMPRDKFKYLKDNQVFSHLPDPWVVGRKDRLMKTLTSSKRRFGASYGFFPEGFTVPDQLDAFKRAMQALPPSTLWILKPPASACGRGIRVLTAKELVAYLASKNNKSTKYVVQKYLSNPLLMDGFKFDLRIYVLVTSVDPLRIYLFEEGLTRFCTTPYTLANTRNRYAHLTNYTINKKNNNFVENTSAESDNVGNKWSMTALLDHLHQRGVVKDVAKLRDQIKDVICKTIIAAEAYLTPLMHQHVKPRTQNIKCYELFGFDMMLDDKCAPWLVEVNVSPSLMAGSPLDKRVKGLLLSDIFHLVGLPVAREMLPRGAVPDAFRREAADSNRDTTSTARIPTINKQLHEVVLDPKVGVLDKKHLELMTPSDWNMIHDMEDEMERLGHFERIFPCATATETARYAPFFTCPRYSNALCVKWIETQRAKTEPSAAKIAGRPKVRCNSVSGTGKSTTTSRRRGAQSAISR